MKLDTARDTHIQIPNVTHFIALVCMHMLSIYYESGRP